MLLNIKNLLFYKLFKRTDKLNILYVLYIIKINNIIDKQRISNELMFLSVFMHCIIEVKHFLRFLIKKLKIKIIIQNNNNNYILY